MLLIASLICLTMKCEEIGVINNNIQNVRKKKHFIENDLYTSIISIQFNNFSLTSETHLWRLPQRQHGADHVTDEGEAERHVRRLTSAG